MPNHSEDIKCQQAEERKKIICYLLMVLLLHLIVCVLFLLPLVRKKKDSEIVLFISVSPPPFIDRWWERFFEIISRKDSFLSPHPCHPNFSSVVITTQCFC